MHPNAYLKNVRNVKCGLNARSKIIETLEAKPSDAARISKAEALSYNVVMHHLRLLKNEGIVTRRRAKTILLVSYWFGAETLAGLDVHWHGDC